MFSNGILNLTNWTANAIMPIVAGLFFAAGIYRYSKAQPYSHLMYSGFAAMLVSGLSQLLWVFAQQSAANDPDRYFIAILTLVDWTGNVILPLYGVIQVVMMVVHFAGVLERITIGEAWSRNALAALACFGLSGILRLVEKWIQNGTGGVPL